VLDPMDIVIAARLSQARVGQTGIDTQDVVARDWAKAGGHNVVHVAADKISGKISPFQRKDLGPWMTDPILMSQYNGLAASKMDRYTRRRDWDIRNWAEREDKKLIIVNPHIVWPPKPGDTATPIIWDTLVNIAVAEWENTSMRYRDMHESLIRGKFLTGGRSFGFDIVLVDGTEHKTLAPNLVESQHIISAIGLYFGSGEVRGRSLEGCCEWLDEQEVPTMRYQEALAAWHANGEKTDRPRPEPWNPKTLRDIFRNPSLIGRRVSDKTGKTILRHAPILDRDTWNRLQAEMDSRAHHKGIVSGSVAMLRNVAYCAKCDGPMYRHPTKEKRSDGTVREYVYYRCYGKSDRNRSKCALMVPLLELNEFVAAHMTSSPQGDEYLTETAVIQPTYETEDEMTAVQQLINEIELDDPKYDEKHNELRKEWVRLKAQLDEEKRARPKPDVISRNTNVKVREHWASLKTDADKRAFLIQSGAGVLVRGRGDYCMISFRPQRKAGESVVTTSGNPAANTVPASVFPWKAGESQPWPAAGKALVAP
jgi:site-specific DNA recombinase